MIPTIKMKLKTLKDIMEEFKSDCIAKDFTESVMINKPLVGANAYYLDRLKQEAIKWIKELEQNGLSYKFKENEYPLWKRGQPEAIKEWIKHFFNITDKDLESAEHK